MKEYKIIINNQEFIIKQDYDGKFIKPDFIKEYEKVGSALKPSFEPIIVARKPFKGSLVDNVIQYGVGGINIDECRVGNEERFNPSATIGKDGIYNWNTTTNENDEYKGQVVNGRFPANTILTYDKTDFDEVCGGFPNTKSQKTKNDNRQNKGNSMFLDGVHNEKNSYNDSGSASRYFYCAKASAKDRNEGLDIEIEEYVLKEDTPKEIEQLILNSLTS